MAITPIEQPEAVKLGVPVKEQVSERDLAKTRETLSTYLEPYEIDDLLDGRTLEGQSAGALFHIRNEARRIGNERQEAERRVRQDVEEGESRQRGAAPSDRGSDWLR